MYRDISRTAMNFYAKISLDEGKRIYMNSQTKKPRMV